MFPESAGSSLHLYGLCSEREFTLALKTNKHGERLLPEVFMSREDGGWGGSSVEPRTQRQGWTGRSGGAMQLEMLNKAWRSSDV